ncbi:MAG: hypothetical protein IT258_00895 [Saprospiraceae bacterium]|nr:hypothetical protein [Saprospiraceae bacterium]
MSVISQLATSLGRRDEVPNQILAKSIADSNNQAAITELVAIVKGKDKNLQSDAIKTLYEVGYLNPSLIAGEVDLFIALLKGKNNRLVWGAMTALDDIASVNPTGVYPHLPLILSVADAGSVITRDHAVGILVKLCLIEKYRDTCFPLLMEQMQKCPTNQFPSYAEKAAAVIVASQKAEFTELLKARLSDLPKESQLKRIASLLKKLNKI